MGDVSSVSMDEGWAFGPQPGTRTRRGWRPFGLAAGVLVAIGVAGLVGFVAFVNVVGQDDAVTTAPPAQPEAVLDEPAAVPAVTPVNITDVRLTDSVDAVTGEPGGTTSVFTMGEPVQLWLSFEA